MNAVPGWRTDTATRVAEGYPVTGVLLGPGRDALDEMISAVAVDSASKAFFFLSGCEQVFPAVTQNTTAGPEAVSIRLKRPLGSRSTLGADDLVSPLSGALGNKLMLGDLLASAGIEAIPCRLYDAGQADAVDAWRSLGEVPVAVQQAADGLRGNGTRFARCLEDLERIVESWKAHPLKVTRFVAGHDLTVSGCVCRDRVLVSGVSQQIVGLSELTPHAAAHCGNQILGASTVDAATIAASTSIGGRVGEAMRARGFLGAFGLDMVEESPGKVWVVEVNPRLQAVTALWSTLELEAGLLPLPLVHLLTVLEVPFPSTVSTSLSISRPASQLFVCARVEGTVIESPAHGKYRHEAERLVRLEAPAALSALTSDADALVWRVADVGARVKPGLVLVAAQVRAEVLERDRPPRLNRAALALVAALERAVVIEP